MIAITTSLALGACQGPGADALGRVARASESLTRIAEAHARGELDGRALATAIGAWSRTDGAAIETIAKDAARALGPALRAALAERWRTASEPLRARLGASSSEKAPPR